MKKCIYITCEVGYKVTEAIILVMVVGVIVLRLILPMAGLNPLICISDSMYPAFEENSICYIDVNCDYSSIKEGDIIAYSLENGNRVTHRVTGICDEGFITKGDANEYEDAAVVSSNQVMGINRFQIPGVGIFFRNFPNRELIMVVGPIVLMLVAFRILCELTEKELVVNE